MKPASSAAPVPESPAPVIPLSDYKDIRTYYDVAGPDYEMWSPNFNMHFGYCKKFTDIFFLERMLMNMNAEVMKELQLLPSHNALIADLGCGVGTVARYAALHFPLAQVTGITISDYQIDKGRELIERDQLQDRVQLMKDNFEGLQAANNSFTHAYAVESACHANGSGKELFIAEMARVLKSGGRFCIADGFLKHNNALPRFFNAIYQKIIHCWALPCFGSIQDVLANLKKYGMKNISVREISYRIAPSVAYVPWTCLKFFVHEIWKNRSLRMEKERWHNVYAPVLGMLLGLHRKHFGYYIISAEKE
ncbi:MAG: methyltransferase domain-containing protein [Bacteroidetes bacterium]|nr:methyltransferase domain-containing protein [Bacteroidota bacterium]